MRPLRPIDQASQPVTKYYLEGVELVGPPVGGRRKCYTVVSYDRMTRAYTLLDRAQGIKFDLDDELVSRQFTMVDSRQ